MKKKKQNRYFLKLARRIMDRFKTPIVLGTDILMAVFSLWTALYLRVGAQAFTEDKYLNLLTTATPIFAFICLVSFWGFRLHRRIWRYASLGDIATITKAVLFAVGCFLGAIFVFNRLESLPRTVPIIQTLILILFMGGARAAYRHLRRKAGLSDDNRNAPKIPILLYGSGDSAELFIRSTIKGPSNYVVVGMIDDHPSQKNRYIHDVKVLGTSKDLEEIIAKLKKRKIAPQRLIITNRQNGSPLKGPALKTLSDRAEQHGLSMARLPRMESFQTGDESSVQNLQPIAIEDILGRPQQVMNKEAIQSMLTGQRILITGAGGSIGSELSRQIVQFNPKELILLENSEHNLYQIDHELTSEGHTCHSYLGDVRDRERLEQIIKKHKPQIIFHAAAYKHVPMVEFNPAEGVLTNIIGSRNVADMANRYGAKAMVQISTDKAVNPTNIMGATKKFAEMYCQSLDLDPKIKTRYMTVRFGNVLGSSGSVVPLFQKQLAKGGPLTVTDPSIERYFMMIPEAVGLVLSASAYGLGDFTDRGKIFVLDMGDPVKIDDIARQMIRLSGLVPDKDIKIEYTGLRPGEKMFEELFNAGEETSETDLKGIQAAMPDPVDKVLLSKGMQELEGASRVNDKSRILRTLGNFVPGFRKNKAA